MIENLDLANAPNFSPRIIRALRKFHKLKQIELATILGIRQGTLSKIESGQLELSASQWIGICHKYSLNPSCIFSGQIEELGNLKLEKGSLKKIGKFNINKKFLRHVGFTVRSAIPFLNFIEDKMGVTEKELFLEQNKLDPDYFVIQNLPINILFFQEMYNHLKDKKLVSPPNINKIMKVDPSLNGHGAKALSFSSNQNIAGKFKKYLDLIPNLYGNCNQFTFVGKKDCFIQIRDNKILDKFKLAEDFNNFRRDYNLAHFNYLASQWGADFKFECSTNGKGWDLVVKE